MRGSCNTRTMLTQKFISDFSLSSGGKIHVNHCLSLGHHLCFLTLKLPSTAHTEAARQEGYTVTGKNHGLLAQAQCGGFLSSETKAFTKKVI